MTDTTPARGPLARYEALVAAGALAPDPAQGAAMARLDALSAALSRKPRLFERTAPPKGIYLWGGVGRGKSLLMDVFFNNTPATPKRRVHFHEFMAETHERIAAFRALPEPARRRQKGVSRAAPDDPIAPTARAVADEARLLCFDELQVTDIADATILGRLFEALFRNGVCVVATSNRRPDDLYKDGLNRQLFTPAIRLLERHLDVIEVGAARDYRLDRLMSARVWHAPLGPEADAAMDAAWTSLICGATERTETLAVKGRAVTAPRTARGAARFSFDALCARPLGAADYLAIVGRYDTLFVDRIPRLSPAMRNEAKRFVTLIDAVYETRTRLVASADAEPSALYAQGDGAFEFQRTASRLAEMSSSDYLRRERVAIAPAVDVTISAD